MNIADFIKDLNIIITIEDILCAIGLILLGLWLLKSSLGRKALVNSPLRRNNMPFYLPLIPLLIWLGSVSLATSAKKRLFSDLPDWQNALVDNIILCLGAIAVTSLTLYLVKDHFARRLKGFGLDLKTIHKDFLAAFVNLITIWPIVLFAFTLTIIIGKFITGQDYQMPQHTELELITSHSQLPLRILIIITAVVIAPVFEEILFRGLFQTMIRSRLAGPWFAIVLSSILFVTIHAHAGHWPTLFVLAVCLGYSYEKSGSLFRPIFIHALFNAAGIIAALNQ